MNRGEEMKGKQITRPETIDLKRREVCATATKAVLGLPLAAKAVLGLPLVSFMACEDLTGPQGAGYTKLVEEKTLQKGVVSALGPLSVQLVQVVVENESKQLMRADVNFLKTDGSVDFLWNFNLNDAKQGIKAPGSDKTSDYSVLCTGLPQFGSSDEWVRLQVWQNPNSRQTP